MTSDQASSDSDVVKRLIVEILQRVEEEGPDAVDAVCAAHPEQAEAVRVRVNALRDAGLLEDRSGDASIPERLGDFRLLERIGGGGMGVVYLAEQQSLGRRVALKLIRPDLLYFPGARERFRREVEAVARLSHPSIAAVHTVGEENGIPFFAMEHVDGISLADVIERLSERAPERLDGADLRDLMGESAVADAQLFSGSWADCSLRIASDVARALEHAHQHGILHRDVKPSNVMIRNSGRVVLLDFGLATSQGAASLTRTGSRLGSLPYMAPEQIDGDTQRVGPRTDVYGLGVTLHELLALSPPYFSESAERLMRDILGGSPPSLRRRNPGVSRDVETICRTAMDPDPDRRYASAEDLARDLTNALELRPIQARRAGPLHHALRFARRRPGAAAAILLATLVVVGGPLGYAIQEARARHTIEQKNVELRQALEEASAQNSRAELNLDQALEAVDRLLATVGDERLANVPQMEELRRELLEEALEFHRTLLQTEEDDPRLLLDRARTEQKCAHVLALLGRLEEARDGFERSLRAFDELPGTVSPREISRFRAAALLDLGRTQQMMGRAEDAEDSLRLAVTLLRGEPALGGDRLGQALFNLGELLRVRGVPDEAEACFDEAEQRLDGDEEARLSLARALLARGRLRVDARRLEDALGDYGAALDLLETLHAEDPDDAGLRRELATAHGGLAQAHVEGSAEGAANGEPHIKRCIELQDQLVRDFPGIPEYRETLATAWSNYGSIHHVRRDFAGQLHCLEQAIAILDPLLAAWPERIGARVRLATFQINLGGTLIGVGEAERACELMVTARDNLELCLAAFPNDPQHRKALATLSVNLGYANLQRGLHRAAADAVKDQPEVEGWLEAIAGGLLLSRCITAAEQDGALDEGERAKLVREYGDRCVVLVRRGIDQGFDRLDDFSGPKWEAARGHSGFRDLLEELLAEE